jgi:hypothetical protein
MPVRCPSLHSTSVGSSWRFEDRRPAGGDDHSARQRHRLGECEVNIAHALGRRVSRHWHADDKRCSLSEFRMDGNTASTAFDDTLYNRKSEAGSRHLPRSGRPIERFKDVMPFIRRHSDSVIRHSQFIIVSPAASGDFNMDRGVNAAILHRVIGEIPYDLWSEPDWKAQIRNGENERSCASPYLKYIGIEGLDSVARSPTKQSRTYHITITCRRYGRYGVASCDGHLAEFYI